MNIIRLIDVTGEKNQHLAEIGDIRSDKYFYRLAFDLITLQSGWKFNLNN